MFVPCCSWCMVFRRLREVHKTRNVRINVKLRRVRVTIVNVGKQ